MMKDIPLTFMAVSERSALKPKFWLRDTNQVLSMTQNIRDTTAVLDASVNSKLWHLRLGHMSEKRMKILLSKGKLPALKLVESNICEDCIRRKQKKVSFVKVGKALKPEKLDLVHTDLWGPSPVASLGRLQYYH
jgi:hypothetical protein